MLSQVRLPSLGSVLLGVLILSAACTDATGPAGTAAPGSPEIVFSSWDGGGLGPGMFRTTLDGSTIHQITDRPSETFAVSPAGDQIAYAVSDDGSDIYVVDIDGSNQRRLTSGPGSNWGPTWSPNGSHIMFTSNRSGQSGIWVMSADGSDNQPLVISEGRAGTPAWSNDGKRIAFSITSGPGFGVYVANSDGSDRRRIAPRVAYWLDWSPDDSALLAIGITDDSGNAGIVRIAADGSEALSLTPSSSGEHRAARWSPDGRTIAFVKLPEGARMHQLYLMDANGLATTPVSLPEGLYLTRQVDWLP